MKTHKQYDELVKEIYDRTMIRLMDNNPLLEKIQKQTLYLYQDFLESKYKQTYVNKYGRTRTYKVLTSSQSLQIYMKEAINFVEFIQKDFIKATRKDIDNYRYYLKKTSIQERARIKQDKWKKLSKNKSGRNPYANNRITKKTYIGQYSIEMYCNIIKRFYLWLYNRDNLIKGEVPHLVSHLQKTKYMENIKKIDPSEVLTTEDIKNMVESCRHIRDKCFISLLYESGARIGELLACNIGSYDDKGQYAYVKLVGKTGTRIPDIIHSLPYIRKWNNEHKYKDDKNALLFVSFTTIIKMEGYLREVVMIFLEILLNELDVNF